MGESENRAAKSGGWIVFPPGLQVPESGRLEYRLDSGDLPQNETRIAALKLADLINHG